MIKAVIIDTDQSAIDELKKCLSEFELIEVVAEAFDFFSGVRAINTHQPQLVFLEIELEDYSGFKVLDCFEKNFFKSVLVTSRTTDAIRAFRKNSNGYILKPVTTEALKTTLDCLIAEILMESRDERKHSGRLVLPAPSGFHYISSTELAYLSSEGKHTLIHKIDGGTLTVPKNLKTCQSLLDSVFIRVHRSFIVNLHFIKHYHKGNDIHLIMENGARVDVGRQYKDELDEVLQYIIK